MLNKEKTSIFFNRNTSSDIQSTILKIARVKSTGSFEKYLDLLAVVGRAKIAAFHPLIDRTRARITNWKTQCLSVARKEVLLKVVLQEILTYTVGIFLFPQSITQRLNQLLTEEVLVGLQ